MAVQAPYQVSPYNPQQGEIPVDGCVQRANAGYLAPGQAKMSVCVDQVSTTGNDFIPLPTPPAGYIWVITDIILTHDQSSGQRITLQAGGITIFSTNCHGSTAPDVMDSLETQPTVPGGVQPALFITGAASMHIFANIYGVLQLDGVG